MKKTDIKRIYDARAMFADKEVTVAGWVRSVRNSKTFGFIDLNDGTCFDGIQVVFEQDKIVNYEAVSKLLAGASIAVTGILVLTPQARQPFELKATRVNIICATDETYPLQKKAHSMEFLRDIAYLRPRTRVFNAVFRIRSAAAFAIHKYFQDEGYLYVHTPRITTADCEGSDQMFKITTLNLKNPPLDKFGKIVLDSFHK